MDSERGEGRRNENLGLTLIDNNVLRDLNERLGTTATLVRDSKIEQSYWGVELGGPPSRPLHLPPARAAAVHGNLYWTHNNSIFSARSFFQVGEVQPARSNDYGFSVSTPLWKGAAFTVDGSQVKNRGQVNGNVLIPSLDERTPADQRSPSPAPGSRVSWRRFRRSAQPHRHQPPRAQYECAAGYQQ